MTHQASKRLVHVLFLYCDYIILVSTILVNTIRVTLGYYLQPRHNALMWLG